VGAFAVGVLARVRVVGVVLAVCILLPAVIVGCSRGGEGSADEAEDVTVELSVEPDPPEVGPAVIEVVLLDEEGEPINDADLEIEGNMSHAGMEPVIVNIVGSQEGRYTTRDFEFTMGGDWIITVSGVLPDGREIEREFDLEGVSS
jgi:hypothetical protein